MKSGMAPSLYHSGKGDLEGQAWRPPDETEVWDGQKLDSGTGDLGLSNEIEKG